MSKILKNTTGSIIEAPSVGLSIPASGQITVNESDYLLLASSDSVVELTTPINSGDIVVNDGSQDLSAADGLEYIKYPDQASSVSFNVSSLTTNSPDLTGLTQTQQVGAALANRHFGKEFAVDFINSNFTTTSTSFQTITTITETLPAGDYIAFAHGKYSKSLISAQMGVRFLLNAAVVDDEEEVVLEDDDLFYGHTSIIYLPNVPAGSNTLNMQIRKISGGGNVQAQERLLMLWR